MYQIWIQLQEFTSWIGNHSARKSRLRLDNNPKSLTSRLGCLWYSNTDWASRVCHFLISYLLNLIWTHLIAPLWEVPILHYTDGVLIPGLGHVPYLCVGIARDVILQDTRQVSVKESVITAYNNHINYYNQKFFFLRQDMCVRPFSPSLSKALSCVSG